MKKTMGSEIINIHYVFSDCFIRQNGHVVLLCCCCCCTSLIKHIKKEENVFKENVTFQADRTDLGCESDTIIQIEELGGNGLDGREGKKQGIHFSLIGKMLLFLPLGRPSRNTALSLPVGWLHKLLPLIIQFFPCNFQVLHIAYLGGLIQAICTHLGMCLLLVYNIFTFRALNSLHSNSSSGK